MKIKPSFTQHQLISNICSVRVRQQVHLRA